METRPRVEGGQGSGGGGIKVDPALLRIMCASISHSQILGGRREGGTRHLGLGWAASRWDPELRIMCACIYHTGIPGGGYNWCLPIPACNHAWAHGGLVSGLSMMFKSIPMCNHGPWSP